MEDIQTQIRFTKHCRDVDKPLLSNYNELLESHPYHHPLQDDELSEDEKLLQAYNRKISPQGSPGIKILVTGEEGTGKTVLCKKITWDWAKGTYVQFSVVFYICSKLVRSTEAIENVIVDQYKSTIPDINNQVVKQILSKVGDRCLIIVDELDTAGQSPNSEFIQRLTHQKYSHLNVLVAVRTGHNLEYLNAFHTEAAIVPTLYPALQNIGANNPHLAQLSERVIHPNIIGSQVEVSHNNPMLRTFLYILAGNRAIDLVHSGVSLGELFTKLVWHIYRMPGFIDHVLKGIGKLAFHSLINSGMISKDILNNDPILVENSHNIITFKQTSMQIYLAALYFVLEIDAGKSVSSLFCSQSTEPPLMNNYVFLYFTLWFLRQRTGEIVLANHEKVHQALVTYVKDQIDFSQLDLRDIIVRFPALDVTIAEKENDQFILDFVKNIITACQNTKVFVAAPDHPIEHILSKTEPIFPKLRKIGLYHRNCPFHTIDAEQIRSYLQITGEEQGSHGEIDVVFPFASKNVQWILNFAQSSTRPFSLYLIDAHSNKKPMIDVSSLMKGKIKKLCFFHGCFVFARENISPCEYLTHLVFTGDGIELDKSLFTALCRAVDDHHLPKMYHLSFCGCEGSPKGKMQYLFKKQWPTLTHLDVTRCILDEQDVQIVCAGADSSRQNSLPKLSSLAISPKYLHVGEKFEFLKKPWNELKSLEILGAEKYDHYQPNEYPAHTVFMNALSQGMFPNLEQIGTSKFFPKQFEQLTSLQSLILSKGRANYHDKFLDVKHLSEEFPVSKLQQIDLSHSRLSSNLAHLVCHEFPRLKNLILRSCGLPPDSGDSLAQANASGKIPQLKQLDLTGNSCSSKNLFEINSPWKELQSLRTSENFWLWTGTFPKVATLIESGYLPKLEEMHVKEYEKYEDDSTCPTCGLSPENVLRREDQCMRLKDVTLKHLLAPIAENLPRLKSSSFEAIYFYIRNIYSLEIDSAQAEKQEITSKNLTIDFAAER